VDHTLFARILKDVWQSWESSIGCLRPIIHKQMAKRKHRTSNSGILMKTVTKGGKDWSKKLDGGLWAYQTTHKTPIGMTPYQFVYGKTCHLQ
jgi:hypothetical protein